VRLVITAAALAVQVWGLYLLIKVAEFVHAWPFG
jgi:hypothetical protein